MIKTIETSSTWNGGAITEDMYTELQQAMIASGEQIATKARSMAPERTGKLKRSIRAVGKKKRSRAELLARGIVSGNYETALPGAYVFAGNRKKRVYWAHWVEFGTYDSPAHPFLRPASDSSFNAVLAEAGRAGRRAINRNRRMGVRT